jgi:hypothetical protein
VNSENAVKVGDRVKWRSQANGNWREKKGTVVAIVPPLADAKSCIPPNAGYRMKKQKTGVPRKTQSYLVNPDGYGTELLWPLVDRMELLTSAIAPVVEAKPTPATPQSLDLGGPQSPSLQ